MSTPADEYNSLHKYQYSYIDFSGKSHCSTARKSCFKLLLYFSSCFLNTILFNSNSSIPPGFFQDFFSVNWCNMWLSSSIFLMNNNGWWFRLFTNCFLKKILDAEMITLWALNFWQSTLARVISQNSVSLILFNHDKGIYETCLSLDLSLLIVIY